MPGRGSPSAWPRWRSSAAAVLVLALGAAACGTRLDESTIAAAARGGGQVAAGPALQGEIAGAEDVIDDAAVAGVSAGPSGAASGGGAAQAGKTTRTGTVNTGSAGTNSTVPQAATGTPVRIGNVGSYSGVIGASMGPALPMIKAWVQWVNDHGGLAGHPIEFFTADDGSDPSRNLSLVKEMVEKRHVVAFVGNMTPLSTNGSRQYLEEKRIPVLGGDISDIVWNSSPMLFPQGTGIDTFYEGLAKLSATTGKKKFGLLYCLEAASCTYAYDKLFPGGGVARAGLEPTYSAKISLVQPDFTSECVAAKDRGVDVLALGSDSNTMARIADSCARQDYHPQWISGNLTATSNLADNPNLDNLALVVPTFPFTYSGSAAAAEYQTAVERYAPGLNLSASTSAIWTAGKLFERAVELAAPSGGDLKTEDVLRGLYAMQDETLGGLAPPLNYVLNQPPVPPPCYFGIQDQGGKWVPLNDGKAFC